MAECYLYHIRRACHAGVLTEGYIGISNNPARRFSQHKAGGCNLHLDRALAKYADIEMVIISEGTRSEILAMEAWLRPMEKVGYNVAAGGGSPPSWEGKSHSDETKQKLSKVHAGKTVSESTRSKLRDVNTGKVIPEDVRAKISSTLQGHEFWGGMTGRSHTEETRSKMSASRIKGEHDPAFKGWWRVDEVKYTSLNLAASAVGCAKRTIRNRSFSSKFPNYEFVPKDES